MIKKPWLIAAILGIAVIGGFLVGTSYLDSQPISQKVESCLERYTTGEKFHEYSVELAMVKGGTRREAITNEQVACIGERLGFTLDEISGVQMGTEGRVDNEKFAMIWATEFFPVCDSTRKWGCSQIGEDTKANLKIVFKDYR